MTERCRLLALAERGGGLLAYANVSTGCQVISMDYHGSKRFFERTSSDSFQEVTGEEVREAPFPCMGDAPPHA